MARHMPNSAAVLCVMMMMTCMMGFHACHAAWTTCQNVCGDVPVMYPFGTGRGCGSKLFERYINCTKGKLQLYTPTGQYEVQSIDYTNNILIIQDAKMSTCSSMQYSNSFGLPVDAPLSTVGDTFVLLGCSSTSSVYNAFCDAGGTSICQSLYSCSSITQLGLAVNGPTSSCCVYSNAQMSNPPYQINLALLQCASYTSIYSFGPQYGYGGGGGGVPSNSYQNSNSWSYGIALKFYYDQSAFYGSCKACQQSNGVCAFNVYGFVCVCSAGVNTTTQCFGNSGGANFGTGSLQLVHESLRNGGLVGLLWIFSGMLFFGFPHQG